MQCISCTNEVSAKFIAAISANACPYCGEVIMDEKVQSTLNSLSVLFNDAKEFMPPIIDWLNTNYNFIMLKPNEVIVDKNTLDKLNQFKDNSLNSVMNKNSNQEQNIEGQQNNSESKEQTVFAKRAGVPQNKVKRAIDFIKGRPGASSGAADPSEFVGEDDEYGDVNGNDYIEDIDPINKRDKTELDGLFDGDDLGAKSQEVRLQRLKQLQKSEGMRNGGDGNFRR